MSIVWSLFLALLVSLLATVLWELLLRDYLMVFSRDIVKRRRLRTLLGLDDNYRIEFGLQGVPPVARTSDTLVESALDRIASARAKKLVGDNKVDDSKLGTNLIVLGGTKYSAYANWIQREYQLPFEHVIANRNTDREVTMMIGDVGEIFPSSADLGLQTDGTGVGYGALFLAESTERKKIAWLSGTHGAPLLGVYKYVSGHPAEFAQKSGLGPGAGIMWLMRVRYVHGSESLEGIREVEVLGSPRLCTRRPPTDRPHAVFFDLGNVLFEFDYEVARRALLVAAGRDPSSVSGPLNVGEEFDDFQVGRLSKSDFFAVLRKKLDLGQSVRDNTIEQAWVRIFWPNRPLLATLPALAAQAKLVLITNNNEPQMQYLTKNYPDVFDLFADRVITSHEAGVSKPQMEFFELAITKLGMGAKARQCLLVDDESGNVEAASQFGFMAHKYSSFPRFVEWIRRHGLYLP